LSSDDERSKDLKMPVNFYKYENTTTITDTINQIEKIKEKTDLLTGFSCSTNETSDSFIVDLSIGNSVDYIKIGGFNRGERVSKINRLLQIEDHLKRNNRLLIPTSLSSFNDEDSNNNNNNDDELEFKFPQIEIPEDLALIINEEETIKASSLSKQKK
jgi:hypothetical protein